MPSQTTTAPVVTAPVVAEASGPLPATVRSSLDRFVRFLETSGTETPADTFAPDVFADLTFPRWRVQLEGAEAMARARQELHPWPGAVRVEQVTGDDSAYAIKLEERWRAGAQDWYCREGFICVLDAAGRITQLTLYCTGDWDEARVREHAAAVTLLRP